MTTELKTVADQPVRRAEIGKHAHVAAGPKIADIGISRRRRGGRRWRALSAILVIAVPVTVASIYYGLIASDQYVSEVRFSVRGKETQNTDALGLLTGFPVTQATSDSYVVADYIKSRELLDELSRSIDLRAMYSKREVDWFARFDATQPIEELVDYWRWMVNVRFDSTSGTIAVGIRAFTPEDAQLIAERILSASAGLVNRLSAEARQDAVRNAEEDVHRMEERLAKARVQLEEFRGSHQIIDPVRSAAGRQELDSKLQAELIQLRSELAATTRFLTPSAPSAVVLAAKIASVEGELTRVRAERMPTREKGPMPEMLTQYDEIETEHQFAEKAYALALASLERTRSEADRRQRFLSVYVSPSLAEEALYPRRLGMIAVITICATMLWGIGLLIVLGVRDHVH
jgi:capsular polysaccharide transport system permease protein